MLSFRLLFCRTQYNEGLGKALKEKHWKRRGRENVRERRGWNKSEQKRTTEKTNEKISNRVGKDCRFHCRGAGRYPVLTLTFRVETTYALEEVVFFLMR